MREGEPRPTYAHWCWYDHLLAWVAVVACVSVILTLQAWLQGFNSPVDQARVYYHRFAEDMRGNQERVAEERKRLGLIDDPTHTRKDAK